MSVATRFHFDESANRTIIERVQDVEPILERNKREAADKVQGAGRSKEMRKVASIPLVVVEKWLREDGLDVFNPDHRVRLLRKLQDPAYRYLRTDSSVLHGRLPPSMRRHLTGGMTESGLAV